MGTHWVGVCKKMRKTSGLIVVTMLWQEPRFSGMVGCASVPKHTHKCLFSWKLNFVNYSQPFIYTFPSRTKSVLLVFGTVKTTVNDQKKFYLDVGTPEL